MNYRSKLNETIEFLKKKIDFEPEIGLILGSGLGVLADEITEAKVIPYDEIPNFPVSTVEGHAGELVIGKLMGKQVITLKGRFHFYEGYNLEQVTFPVRLMQLLGVKKLIVTNAAGGININFNPGDLMIISDHINLTGNNPLIGPNDNDLGPRFSDMSEAYNKELIKLAEEVAAKEGVLVRKGVYAGLTGPNYETPSEIRFLRLIGADAVGMSTVPEVIIANHGGMKVLGISCISNMAAGILPVKLNHEEVMETANLVRDKFLRFVKGILKAM